MVFRLVVRGFAASFFGLALAWGLLAQLSQVEWLLEKLRSLGPFGTLVANHMGVVLAIVGFGFLAMQLERATSKTARRLRGDCRGLADEISGFVSERRNGTAGLWDALRLELERVQPVKRPDASQRGRRRISNYMEETVRLYEPRFAERVANVKARMDGAGHADEQLKGLTSRSPASITEIEAIASRLKVMADKIPG